VVAATVWSGAVPEFRPRVVVAAPHPDDEVLGTGGMMRWLDRRGHRVCVVAVTDGAASHARSRRISRSELVRLRARERIHALTELGLGHLAVRRLGLDDAEVARDEERLVDELRAFLGPDTTLVVPWRHDGHPDHEAVARAGRLAAQQTAAGLLEVPIWARVRGRRPDPSYVLQLDADLYARKWRAIRRHRSQLVPFGPDAVDGPVVHPDELDAMVVPTEWFVADPA
jgi:LmbE family N-acetylglucosaminyl deacetylase